MADRLFSVVWSYMETAVVDASEIHSQVGW